MDNSNLAYVNIKCTLTSTCAYYDFLWFINDKMSDDYPSMEKQKINKMEIYISNIKSY